MQDEQDHLSLGYYRGPLERVLAAIQAAGLRDAVLELDGDPSEELFDFAEEVTANDVELREKNRVGRTGRRRRGPFVFGGGPLHIPVNDATLARLREMTDRHADPEIAIALRVLAGAHVILDAPDVGDNEIWVSRRLSAEAVEAIRTELGGVLDGDASE